MMLWGREDGHVDCAAALSPHVLCPLLTLTSSFHGRMPPSKLARFNELAGGGFNQQLSPVRELRNDVCLVSSTSAEF